MTVTNTTRKVRTVGNGAVTAFSFSFKILDQTDLLVYKIDKTTSPETLNLQTLTTNYTVAINAVTEGGTVTYVVAPTANEDSFIVRQVGRTQPADIPTESNFPEATVENQFDRSRMIDLEIIEELDRTIKFPVNSTTTDITLPEPEASKVLGWNAAATAMVNYAFTELTTIEADITLATGDATKLVQVNSAETGYELGAKMPSLTGNGGKDVRVNSGADGYEIVDRQVPAGCILPYGGSTAPAGYVLCDGTAYDSVANTVYAALFTAIGNTFGGSDGTDFQVPDLRGRFPLGKDDMGGVSANRVTDADADTLGGADGDETKTIAEANLPSHTHSAGTLATGSAGSHSHTVGKVNNNNAGTQGIQQSQVANDTTQDTSTEPAHTHTITGSTGSIGSGTALDVMNPFLTLNYIIKL